MRCLLILAFSTFISLGSLRLVAEPGQSSQDKSPKEAVAVLMSTQGNDVPGFVVFGQRDGFAHITGEIRGLSPGKHGFHIHQFGDVRADDGSSAGGHYDPRGHKHGRPGDREHHAGDLGNIVANELGVAMVDKKAEGLELQSVIGRAIVVHGEADDFVSQPSGDAGPRVALGVIGIANVKNGNKEQTQ